MNRSAQPEQRLAELLGHQVADELGPSEPPPEQLPGELDGARAQIFKLTEAADAHEELDAVAR